MAIQYISPRMSLIRKSFLFVREGLVYLRLGEKMTEIQTQEHVGDMEKGTQIYFSNAYIVQIHQSRSQNTVIVHCFST